MSKNDKNKNNNIKVVTAKNSEEIFNKLQTNELIPPEEEIKETQEKLKDAIESLKEIEPGSDP